MSRIVFPLFLFFSFSCFSQTDPQVISASATAPQKIILNLNTDCEMYQKDILLEDLLIADSIIVLFHNYNGTTIRAKVLKMIVVIPIKSGFKEINLNSAIFNETVKKLFGTLKKGSKFHIERIEVSLPDGSTRYVPDITQKIK